MSEKPFDHLWRGRVVHVPSGREGRINSIQLCENAWRAGFAGTDDSGSHCGSHPAEEFRLVDARMTESEAREIRRNLGAGWEAESTRDGWRLVCAKRALTLARDRRGRYDVIGRELPGDNVYGHPDPAGAVRLRLAYARARFESIMVEAGEERRS